MARFLKIISLLLGAILYLTSTVMAREVYIKDWGMVEVDNEHFISLRGRMKPSSQISRMFYDVDNRYLLISVNGTFHHYCHIPQEEIDTWLDAPSLSEYYFSRIQGNYDCQVNPAPDYRK